MRSEANQGDHGDDGGKYSRASEVRSGWAHALHGHLHAIDLEGEARVNNLLVHASVEVRAGVLHDHAILHADLRAAVLVATDFLFAHVVFGIGTTLWSIVVTFAHVVHGVHEVVVEFGCRLLLVAIWRVGFDLDVVAVSL